MKEEQWKEFSRAARGELDHPILSLIVDSPWIPTYYDINYLDYYLQPDQWFEWNEKLYDEYPEVVFIPGFWVEYGMVAEASGFGGRLSWFEDGTPNIHPVIEEVEEVSEYEAPKPRRDGLMPLLLRLYHYAEERLADSEHRIKMVAARGPLQVASWIRGLNNFAMDIKKNPEQAKQLIRLTTDTTISWLRAQIEDISTVEGILLLDDIAGFFSPEDFEEFCYPYLQEVFESFQDKIRVYHNDYNTSNILHKLNELDFEVFNFSHELNIPDVAEPLGSDKMLMGNVAPVDVLTRGTPNDVRGAVAEILDSAENPGRLILSAGGGVAPDTPIENIEAMVDELNSFVN